jgi:hypothetical protein
MIVRRTKSASKHLPLIQISACRITRAPVNGPDDDEPERVLKQYAPEALGYFQCLRQIRDKELYRCDYASWDQYCRHRWGLTAELADALIEEIPNVERLCEGL